LIDCGSIARLKIAMDITRGYIEDSRLEGYQYQGDAAKPSQVDIPPFLDYDNLICDLTKDFEDLAKDNDNEEIFEDKVKKQQKMKQKCTSNYFNQKC
jgi:hypothetical protein